jgi:hypothetical protein
MSLATLLAEGDEVAAGSHRDGHAMANPQALRLPADGQCLHSRYGPHIGYGTRVRSLTN